MDTDSVHVPEDVLFSPPTVHKCLVGAVRSQRLFTTNLGARLSDGISGRSNPARSVRADYCRLPADWEYLSESTTT